VKQEIRLSDTFTLKHQGQPSITYLYLISKIKTVNGKRITFPLIRLQSTTLDGNIIQKTLHHMLSTQSVRQKLFTAHYFT
jgi:hypothetical protein